MRTYFHLLIFTLFSSISFMSCSHNEVVEATVPKGTPFEIQAWNYARNYFFVDTSYLRLYEPFFQSYAPTITDPSKRIIEIEVWESVYGNGVEVFRNSIQGVCHVALPERGIGYDASLRYSAPDDGRIEIGRFVRMDSREFELIGDGFLGLIAVRAPMSDNQILAVAYRTADGKKYGELRADFSQPDSNFIPLFKLVKPKNLFAIGRSYDIAWKLLLKSVYQIGPTDVSKSDFLFEVWRRSVGQEDKNEILGHKLLHVLGVDNLTIDGARTTDGDNVFDFVPGRTINQQYGEIILPSLRPFHTGILNYFRERGIEINDTSEVVFPAAYDTVKTVAMQSISNRYVIRGRARSRE